jgi:hypothetical protein
VQSTYLSRHGRPKRDEVVSRVSCGKPRSRSPNNDYLGWQASNTVQPLRQASLYYPDYNTGTTDLGLQKQPSLDWLELEQTRIAHNLLTWATPGRFVPGWGLQPIEMWSDSRQWPDFSVAGCEMILEPLPHSPAVRLPPGPFHPPKTCTHTPPLGSHASRARHVNWEAGTSPLSLRLPVASRTGSCQFHERP